MTEEKSLHPNSKEEKNSQKVNFNDWVENCSANNSELAKIKGKIKRITFEVSEKQHQATKILAAQKGLTIKELMQSLLTSELNHN